MRQVEVTCIGLKSYTARAEIMNKLLLKIHVINLRVDEIVADILVLDVLSCLFGNITRQTM